MKYARSLFIFRRSLRLDDNTGLLAALEASESVVPCFIFEPKQIDTKKNSYKSENAVQFMVASLRDLNEQLKKTGGRLFVFHSDTITVIKSIIRETKAQALFLNDDYTPFSIKRDKKIAKLCSQLSVDLHTYADVTLTEPGEVMKKDGDPYKVFTSFHNVAITHDVLAPRANRRSNYYKKRGRLKHEIDDKKMDSFYEHNNEIIVLGGRSAAKKILRKLKNLQAYGEERNFPAVDTSLLSAYHKFGCISVRESLAAMQKYLKNPEPIIRQLYWRDFYVQLAYHFPYVFGQGLKDTYDHFPWSTSRADLRVWQEGKTGYPIVDAGMRQLNTTGWMHNRVRLIVASFLVKHLLIDWRAGEKYFARKLVDYDPAVNNGNWQWVAGIGADYQNRMFNPFSQSERYDKEAHYIKQWVPELERVPASHIHKWEKYNIDYPDVDYPHMIVDHRKAYARFKEILNTLR